MATIGYPMRAGLGSLALLGMVAFGTPAAAAPDADGAVLAAHRAIYDLKLAEGRGKRSLQAVRGRIVYDFAGNACEGYALQFRQVTELDSGEGKVAVSDLRTTTWEDAEGTSFRFNSQNFLNRELSETVDGQAKRKSDGVAVSLRKPEDKTFDLGTVGFPTEHMRKIINAAREGKTLLELAVYDGSDNGEKVYQSLTVIGRKIAPDERKPTDAAAGQALLASMARWPVTVSYFDKTGQGGEQTPAYSIAFELYENGISRALLLDYGDFAVAGEMTSLEIKEPKPCK